MRRTPFALLAALAVGATAFSAVPSPPSVVSGTPNTFEVPYAVTDIPGDANAVNGQGFDDSVPETATGPAQLAEADILGGRVTSVYESVVGPDGLLDHHVTGLEFRTALAAAPSATSAPLLHRFNLEVGGCPIFVQAYSGANAAAASFRLNGTGCGLSDAALSFETLSGPWISSSFDAEHGELVVRVVFDGADPRVGQLLPTEGYLHVTELESRGNNVAVVAPVYDATGDGWAEVGVDVPEDEVDTGGGGDGGSGGGGGGEVVVADVDPCERELPSPGAPTAPQGVDRTGVTADTLTLGLHAPVTGSAPLPATSFEQSRELYWEYVTDTCGETVVGRSTVAVRFADDRYDPSRAIQTCAELASSSFLLVGLSGVDQQQACGTIANDDMVPYFTPGSTEAGMEGNPWYFAQTMSLRQQGGLLAQYVRANPGGIAELGGNARIGTIITNTGNFADALHGWEQGLIDNGLTNIDTFEYPKGDTSWYGDVASRFRDQGVEVVYFLGAAVDYINFANTANERFGYNPRFVGVDAGQNLDAVLASGCGQPGTLIDGGIHLRAVPGMDHAPTAFHEAATAYDAPADDIALQLWANAEQLHGLFDRYEATFGTDLTREDFRDLAEDSATGGATYPAATWSPVDHFGGAEMYVVGASCTRRQHVTLHGLSAGF